MAFVADNVLTEGLSGRLGASLVFRTLRGKTFVTTPARKPDKRKETTAQRGTRVTFRQAAAWAQHILQDAAKKEYYTKRAKALKLPNAYTAALTDYMRKPQLSTFIHADKSTYCTVSKKGFVLKAVSVTLHDATGTTEVTRTAAVNRYGDFTFLLTEVERSKEAIITIYDVADQVVTIRLH